MSDQRLFWVSPFVLKQRGGKVLATYPMILAGEDIIQPLIEVSIWGEANVIKHRPAAQHSRHGLRSEWYSCVTDLNNQGRIICRSSSFFFFFFFISYRHCSVQGRTDQGGDLIAVGLLNTFWTKRGNCSLGFFKGPTLCKIHLTGVF